MSELLFTLINVIEIIEYIVTIRLSAHFERKEEVHT